MSVVRVGFIMRAHPRDEAGCVVSGAAKNPFRLLRSLREHVEVTGVVVVDHPGGFAAHGYPVRGRPVRGLRLYARTLGWNVLNLGDVVRLFRASDVVQCHHPSFGLGAAVLRRLIFRRVLLVVKAHGTAVPELAANRYGGLRGRVLRANAAVHRRHDRLVLRCADVCLVSSDHQIAEMVDIYGVPRAKVRRIYNGVDPEYVGRPTQDAASAATALRLLFVGRVVPKKGFGHLFDLYERVKQELPATSLTLVLGHRDHVEDPTTFDLVRRRAGQVDDCRLLFDLSEPDLFALMRSSHLGVVPSQGYESIPTVVLEMSAVGVPTFATWRWGIPEVLPSELGLSGDTSTDVARLVAFARTRLPAWDAVAWAERFRPFHYDQLVQSYLDLYGDLHGSTAA